MQKIIFGDTADDCLVKTIKAIKKYGREAESSEPLYFSLYPVVICLTNPLARFSLSPVYDAREGIILGICALAGVNSDDLITQFGIPLKPSLPGPYFRGFNGDPAQNDVRFEMAGARAGKIDQIQNAIEYLKKSPGGLFTISLFNPAKEADLGSGAAVSMQIYLDGRGRLTSSVYVPKFDLMKEMVRNIIPTYTFIQQVIAVLVGKEIGQFYIISDTVYYSEDERDQGFFEFPIPHLKDLKTFKYTEIKEIDLRYLDMIIQHFVGFARRISSGDLLTPNPFDPFCHLEVFFDYAESLRYGEAVEKGISWEGDVKIKHSQLRFLYKF
jgi:hypothetical protein